MMTMMRYDMPCEAMLCADDDADEWRCTARDRHDLGGVPMLKEREREHHHNIVCCSKWRYFCFSLCDEIWSDDDVNI